MPATKRCEGKASASLLDTIDRALRVDEGERPQNVRVWRSELEGSNDASGKSVAETLIDFARTGNEEMLHGVLIRPIAGDRYDVEMYMAQDYTATSTDAGIALEATPGRHPRFWGSYPRKIAHYTRDRGLITLPFMVRSSTSLPAAIVGMTDRGCLRVGCKADVVAFDYDRVEDNATIMNPDGPVVGMPWVLVNGEVAIEDGQATGALAGVVIKRGE